MPTGTPGFGPLDLTAQPFRRTGGARAGAPGSQPVPVVFPPEVYPIPGAILFNPSVQSLAVTNAAPVVLASVVVPAASYAVIRRIQFGVNNMTAASLLTWTIRGNQGALLLNSFAINPARAATFTGDDQDILIRVPQGIAVLDLLVSVGAGDPSTYQVGGMFSGWYWTLAQEAAYRAGIA